MEEEHSPSSEDSLSIAFRAAQTLGHSSGSCRSLSILSNSNYPALAIGLIVMSSSSWRDTPDHRMDEGFQPIAGTITDI